jgi:hypothetical protein
MDKPTVSSKYDIIQYGGNTYNIPTSLNLRNDLKNAVYTPLEKENFLYLL